MSGFEEMRRKGAVPMRHIPMPTVAPRAPSPASDSVNPPSVDGDGPTTTNDPSALGFRLRAFKGDALREEQP